MVTEVRRIIFTHGESGAAIRSHGEKEGLKFPEGKLIRARFAGSSEYEFHSMKTRRAPIQSTYNILDTSRAVTLTFFDEITLEQKYFNVTSNFLSIALIEYCIANKIMMPKAVQKALDITDFNMCIDLSTETSTKESHNLTLEE